MRLLVSSIRLLVSPMRPPGSVFNSLMRFVLALQFSVDVRRQDAAHGSEDADDPDAGADDGQDDRCGCRHAFAKMACPPPAGFRGRCMFGPLDLWAPQDGGTSAGRSGRPAWRQCARSGGAEDARFPPRQPHRRARGRRPRRGRSAPSRHAGTGHYSLKMCAPSMPASALRVSTTTGARRAISA